MYPTLLEIGPFAFHAYAVCLAAAFLIGVLGAVWANERQPEPYNISTIGGIYVFLGALFGARLWFILQFPQFEIPLYRAFFIWEQGLVFYGGFLGGIAGAIVYLRLQHAPMLAVGDLAMPFVPLAHAVARFGCFLNGCCWGLPTNVPWAVHYPDRWAYAYRQHVERGLIDAGSPISAAVHPVQLYETTGLLVCFGLMLWAARRPHPVGGVVTLYPMLYGVVRFTTEAFRGDSARPLAYMTLSQWVSVGLVVFGVLAYRWAWRDRDGAPESENHTGDIPNQASTEEPV